jgi:ABC-type lipoprotein export system ATPase subunit
VIEARGLVKSYGSGRAARRVLDGVDLDVEAGELVAVTGRSGSGKSTLLHLLGTLDRPDAGSVRLAGTPVHGRGERSLADVRRRHVGFVFQFFHLIPSLTAYENVAVPMEIAGASDVRSRTERLLEEVGLTGRSHHYPSQLSGGEQQRVALARALANNPPIVLADEPTGNLDSANGRHIMELLRSIHSARGTTIVLVTHDAELAGMADARLVLRDGRVTENTLIRRPFDTLRVAPSDVEGREPVDERLPRPVR